MDLQLAQWSVSSINTSDGSHVCTVDPWLAHFLPWSNYLTFLSVWVMTEELQQWISAYHFGERDNDTSRCPVLLQRHLSWSGPPSLGCHLLWWVKQVNEMLQIYWENFSGHWCSEECFNLFAFSVSVGMFLIALFGFHLLFHGVLTLNPMYVYLGSVYKHTSIYIHRQLVPGSHTPRDHLLI